MLQERIEGKWIDCFERVFALCKVKPGEVAAIVSESQSRPIHSQLAELALQRLGAHVFHISLPTPRQHEVVPVRSTGASIAIQRLVPVVKACAAADFVVDCTVEGMLHAPELPEIVGSGARLFMISNEHPEALERLAPSVDVRDKVMLALSKLENAGQMRVVSKGGTDLTIDIEGAPCRGAGGIADAPGKVGYWPAGLVVCYPKSGCVNGTLVLDKGDINLTFKRYMETPIHLRIEDDYVTDIEGDGVDADLLRSYFAAWGDREAYATSHVGWGMNPKARWDAMVMYDKRDTNGSEQRAFAGNFLYSTGANEYAGRFTAGHFDLPMRNCTVTLDNETVVEEGRLVGDLAYD